MREIFTHFPWIVDLRDGVPRIASALSSVVRQPLNSNRSFETLTLALLMINFYYGFQTGDCGIVANVRGKKRTYENNFSFTVLGLVSVVSHRRVCRRSDSLR